MVHLKNDYVKIAGYLEMLAESVHKALIKDRFLFKIVNIVVVMKIFQLTQALKLSPSGLRMSS